MPIGEWTIAQVTMAYATTLVMPPQKAKRTLFLCNVGNFSALGSGELDYQECQPIGRETPQVVLRRQACWRAPNPSITVYDAGITTPIQSAIKRPVLSTFLDSRPIPTMPATMARIQIACRTPGRSDARISALRP